MRPQQYNYFCGHVRSFTGLVYSVVFQMFFVKSFRQIDQYLHNFSITHCEVSQGGKSSDVTTNQTFALIGPHLVCTNAILDHSLYNLGQGTGNI